MYRIVQSTSDVRIPIGTSREGFRASSACVEIESKPIYAKKTIAAPASMPTGEPAGPVRPNTGWPKKLSPVSPNGAKGDQLAGVTYLGPTRITKQTIKSFRNTIAVFRVARSRI